MYEARGGVTLRISGKRLEVQLRLGSVQPLAPRIKFAPSGLIKFL